MEIVVSSSPKPGGWEGFSPETGHPAQLPCFAELYRNSRTRPLFLEAFRGGVKSAQWLVFRNRLGFLPFAKIDIFSLAGPQVVESELGNTSEFFTAFISWIKINLKPVSITVLNRALVRDIPRTAFEINQFQTIDECVPYLSSLLGTEEELLNRFNSSHRNDTRKAIKEGYVYIADLDPEEYYGLSQETYGRSNREGPQVEYIHLIQEKMVKAGKAFLSGVKAGGRLASASIVIYHGRRGFYLHGASSSEKSRGSTTWIHYKNMLRLRDLGILYYDMGGAKLSPDSDEKAVSLTLFKSRFGGEAGQAFGGIWKV